MRIFRRVFERLLEAIVVALIVALTAIVVAGFVFRYLGHPLVWYDELASVGLVWLTYFGAALAALKGGHLGIPAVVNALPRTARVAATVIAEACVFVFFVVLTVTGLEVVEILEGSNLVSLPWVPLSLTQAVIPIGAVLFMIAEALRLPEVLRQAYRGDLVDVELREIMEGAEATEAGLRAEGRA